jgi:hypothetical protein
MQSRTPFVVTLDVKAFRSLVPFRVDLHRGPIALAGPAEGVQDTLLLLRSVVSLQFEALQGEAFHVAFELEHGQMERVHLMSIELFHTPTNWWVRVSWSQGERRGVFDADSRTWSNAYATSPLQRRFWAGVFLRPELQLVPFGVIAPCVIGHPLRSPEHVRGLRPPDAEVVAVEVRFSLPRLAYQADLVPRDVVAGLGLPATSCWWLEAVGACVALRHPVVRATQLVPWVVEPPGRHGHTYSHFEFSARLAPGGPEETDAVFTDLQRSALAFGWALGLMQDGVPLFVVEAPESLVNEALVELVRERLEGRQWFFVADRSAFAQPRGSPATMTLEVEVLQ